jgi:hypothetical protein
MPFDLAETVGSGNVNVSTNNSGWTDVCSFQMDVSALTPIPGNHYTHMQLSLFGAQAQARWRVEAVDSAGAVVATGYTSAEVTAAGGYDDTLLLDWPDTATDLRLVFAMRSTDGSLQSIRIVLVSCYDITPFVVPSREEEILEEIVSRVSAISQVAGSQFTLTEFGYGVKQPSDVNTPAVWVFKAEIKDRNFNGLGSAGDRKTATLVAHLRLYVLESFTLLDSVRFQKDVVVAIEAAPLMLGLSYVHHVNVIEITETSTELAISDRLSMSDMTVEVEYRMALAAL